MRTPLGVRGYTLLLCAFIWSLVGYGILAGRSTDSPGTFHDELPTWARLAIWFLPAGAALLTAWAPRWDWVALGLLIVGPVIRCCSYLTSWALWLTEHQGIRTGWYAAALYLALVGIVGIAAASHRQTYLTKSDGGAGGAS
ncbi:MAG TPA: hypothetical protein VFM01_04660 [Nakamurella sp.]|nr:hypothetical protein [Nakamurella sp.]